MKDLIKGKEREVKKEKSLEKGRERVRWERLRERDRHRVVGKGGDL